jgi:hypothetical protein
MSYVVKWQPRALRNLANAYVKARAVGQGKAVTQASAQIDILLAASPESEGESREDDERVIFVWPLAVHYQVIAGRRRVIVQSVRLIMRLPP